MTPASLVRRYSSTDEGPTTVRFPLEVGILIVGPFADAIAYGRSLGLTIEAHRGGGVLVRRYQMVVAGPWVESRKFLELLADMESRG